MSEEQAFSPMQAFMAAAADQLAPLAGENPQLAHQEKLSAGIEEIAPGVVSIRRMADVLALTRSRAVRQFGTGPLALANLLSGGGLGGHYTAIPLELNGREHTRWRKLLDPVFAPKRISVLEPRVRERANALIDTFIDHEAGDAYEAWCEPLPSSIFLSIMGIPQSERAGFIEFKNTILDMNQNQTAVDPEKRDSAFSECEAWFAAEFDRRERSGDLGDDLIGWLLQVEVDGRRISRDELHGICNLLMIAGLDTVTASLSCMLARLARDEQLRQELLARPSLWPSAIEELMRIESPVTIGYRHVVEDVELPSGTLKAGTSAIVWWAAANVDPETFEDPLDVRLDRSPNPHIGFASGWHRCLGSHLARMELRAALEVWHNRIPDYRIPDGVELTYSINPRAPHKLPITWAP